MQPARVRTAVTIDAEPERVYAFWSDLENFKTFIPALADVRMLDDLHSCWVVRAPLGYEIRFDSRIVERRPPERLVWETRHHAGTARGELTFSGDGRGTRVDVDFSYSLANPWLRRLARAMRGFHFPEHAFEVGLRRIKERIETSPR